MLWRSHYWFSLMAWALTATGCSAPQMAEQPRPVLTANPIQFESPDLAVTLVAIIGVGHEETLVEDEGWREFIVEIENRSALPLTLQNVKLLNVNGRYVDSASSYAQITAPPDATAELASGVAKDAAGMVAGQFIPYGGFITNVFSSAMSASSAEAKANAKRIFGLRVLKTVELAPGGNVRGSAFLPNIANPKALIIDYGQGDRVERIEIPLPLTRQQIPADR